MSHTVYHLHGSWQARATGSTAEAGMGQREDAIAALPPGVARAWGLDRRPRKGPKPGHFHTFAIDMQRDMIEARPSWLRLDT